MVWLDQFLQDLRFGARSFIRNRGFTAIAVASLALGIGASTAMFSVIHAVVLEPFPYKDVDSLMSVRVWDPGGRGSRLFYSVDQYVEIAERSTIFDGVIASTISDVVWTGDGDPQRLRGNHCSVDTFDVMGVAPLIGRTSTAADARSGAEPVAVLGYKFWQRQFGADPAVLGRKMQLNGVVRTVIGVMPPRFMWRGADVYLPVIFQRGIAPEGVRDVHVLGRLKPGVTEAQAEADLRPVIEELQRREPFAFPRVWRAGLLSFKETFPSGIREALWILFGAVCLLLLIACVNVSNLLLSKAASRSREIAVRASLGAGRARLIRQMLVETVVLGVAGGLAGVALAYAGLRAIIAIVPPGTIPDESKIEINAPVLLFTMAVALGSAILSGLLPALTASSRDLVTPLKESSRGSSGGRRQHVLRAVMVSAEVALSLMLLVGASLMLKTLLSMQKLDLGMQPEKILTLRVPFSRERYPEPKRRAAFIQELLTRVEAIPGVAAAGVSSGLRPIFNQMLPAEVPDSTRKDSPAVMVNHTSDGYFRVAGISLRKGRFFTAQEAAAKSQMAVVNQAFERIFFPGGDPLGRIVRIPRFRSAPVNLADDSFQIVGVASDSLNRVATNETVPEIHLPHTVAGVTERLFVLSHGAPSAISSAVRAQVYSLDGSQPVMDVRTMESVLQDFVYARPRFNLALFSLFAGLGLTLALFGVYGIVSNTVAERTQEIGIRIALGATITQIVGMMLSGGVRLVAYGIVAGLLGSLASVRLLSRQVWNLSTFDPLTFAGVAALLVIAGAAASLWPAYQAARVDPARSLRNDN